MNTSAAALYYNETLLAEAGITIPEADPNNRLTWEELVEMAEKALAIVDPDGTKGINGIVFEQANTAYQMLSLPNSLGRHPSAVMAIVLKVLLIQKAGLRL